jgi:hypothetical protein
MLNYVSNDIKDKSENEKKLTNALIRKEIEKAGII